MTSLNPLLTVAEVAGILRCSERTIYRLIKAGKLKAVRTGRQYRFRSEDLAEFLSGSETKS